MFASIEPNLLDIIKRTACADATAAFEKLGYAARTVNPLDKALTFSTSPFAICAYLRSWHQTLTQMEAEACNE